VNVLYPSSSNFWYPRVFAWSNGTYSLLLDTDEELDFALDEDFAELLLDTLVSLSLDFGVTLEDDERTELLDTLVSLSLDFGVTLEDDERTLLLEATLDDERTELLEATLDDERTELLDCGVTLSLLDEVGSSSRGAKLLSSSPQATTKNAKRRANKKCINPPNPFYLKYTFC